MHNINNLFVIYMTTPLRYIKFADSISISKNNEVSNLQSGGNTKNVSKQIRYVKFTDSINKNDNKSAQLGYKTIEADIAGIINMK